jgi:hypothetical protein
VVLERGDALVAIFPTGVFMMALRVIVEWKVAEWKSYRR